MCTQNPNLPYYFSRAPFYKRSSSLLQEVERGTAGGGERGALPSGPLNLTRRAATAGTSEDLPAVPAYADKAAFTDNPASADCAATAEHAPLGAEEKVP